MVSPLQETYSCPALPATCWPSAKSTCIAILRRPLRAKVVDGYLWRVERQWRHALAATSPEKSSGEQSLGAGVPRGRPRARRNLLSSSGGAVP